jgi:hypothetical protein
MKTVTKLLLSGIILIRLSGCGKDKVKLDVDWDKDDLSAIVEYDPVPDDALLLSTTPDTNGKIHKCGQPQEDDYDEEENWCSV